MICRVIVFNEAPEEVLLSEVHEMATLCHLQFCSMQVKTFSVTATFY